MSFITQTLHLLLILKKLFDQLKFRFGKQYSDPSSVPVNKTVMTLFAAATDESYSLFQAFK